MTDARHPERWLLDRRIQKLSDAAYRLFFTSLAWSVANRTDGVLLDEDLNLMPNVATGKASELVKAQLWRREPSQWVISDYASTQTSRRELEVLENLRRREREKKARQRAAALGDSPPGLSPGTVPPGQHRQEGRQEGRQDCLGGEPVNEQVSAGAEPEHRLNARIVEEYWAGHDK